MRQARSGLLTLVDEEVWPPVADPTGFEAGGPSGRNCTELVVVQLGEGANVAGAVDDHLLVLERRVEVGHDADKPAGRVGLPPRGRDREHLGRRAVLASLAERAALELFWRRRRLRVDVLRPGPLCALRRDDDDPAGDRIAPEVRRRQLGDPPPPPMFRNGLKSSIGSGRMIVDERSELISSIVCRKRSWSDIGFSAST